MAASVACLARIVLGGVTCPNVVEIEIASDGALRASTFQATLALADLPVMLLGILQVAMSDPGSRPSVAIEIGLGPDPRVVGWQRLLTGLVDRVGIDVGPGLVQIEGRDLVGQLVDQRVAGDYVNQTSSDIVTTLAVDAGLIPDVVPTSTIVGQYYEIDHARSALHVHGRFANAWELICSLAQLETYDAWVSGQTLHFRPTQLAAGTVWAIDVPSLQRGVPGSLPLTRFRLDCNLDIGDRRSVQVQSWNSRERCSVQATYPDDATITGDPAIFLVPNLTSETAMIKAISLYRELARHRYVASGDMPGDLALMPRDRVSVAGSGVGMDGSYVVDVVTRRIDVRGYRQSFVARLA